MSESQAFSKDMWDTIDRLALPRDRIEWALDFSQIDLKKVSPGRRVDLAFEVMAFEYWGGIDDLNQHSPDDDKKDLSELVTKRQVSRWKARTESDLESLQARFRRIFDCIVRNEPVYIGVFEVTMICYPAVNPPIRKVVTPMSKRADAWDGPDDDPAGWDEPVAAKAVKTDIQRQVVDSFALFALSLLLDEYAPLTKACPAPKLRSQPGELCGRWFVGRPNQTYCSPLCQNRATTRASRERKARNAVPRKRGRPRKET